MKILVVDDELDVKILFEQRFRKEIRSKIVDFAFAFSGKEALEYIDKLDEKEIWVYHRKLLSFKLDNRVGYYEFNPRDRLYILSMEGWEKSDAISLENFLPNRSREIKAWSKSWQDNKKKDASGYLRALLKELNQN